MALHDLRLTRQSIVRETPKAVCVLDGDREYWIPRKLITWNEDGGSCYLPTIQIPFWFAKQNGMVRTGRNPGF